MAQHPLLSCGYTQGDYCLALNKEAIESQSAITLGLTLVFH